MSRTLNVFDTLCSRDGAFAGLCESGAMVLRKLAFNVPAAGFVNLAILALVIWCLYRGLRSARREARGYAMSIQRFGSVPVLALASSLLALLGPVDRPQNVILWLMALACGFTVGAFRGCFVVVQADRERRLIRIRHAEDGLLAMRILVMFGALEVLSIAAQRQDSFWRPLLAACTAICAAFLVGRFTSVWLRARSESHMELTGAVRTETELLMIGQGAPTWSSGTARLIPGYVAVVPPDWQTVECATASDGESIAVFSSARAEFTRPVRRDSRGRFMSTSCEDIVSTISARHIDTSAS